MEYLINGGQKLYGSVEVECAKNAYLPILAATILCDGDTMLDRLDIIDVENMLAILQVLGVKVRKEKGITIDSGEAKSVLIPTKLTSSLRASILCLGALLGRFHFARITYPGGCDIGLRPINLHIKCMQELGVEIEESHGVLNCDSTKLHGGVVVLDYASVGVTENLILLTVLGKENVTLINVAREPEVVDLCLFLNSCGANIVGAGSSEIRIFPVRKLTGVGYSVMKDRIVAGTFLLAGAITGGEIEVCGLNPNFFTSLIKKLCQTGCFLDVKGDKIRLKSNNALISVGFLETNVYPAFPTDLQPQFLALQTLCRGECLVRENIFEGRFKFVHELIKLGARVVVCGNVAIVTGVDSLMGAEVVAPDLRGGAALVLAGLAARGYTRISQAELILRGYENFEQKLISLGADIKLI